MNCSDGTWALKIITLDTTDQLKEELVAMLLLSVIALPA